MARRGKPSRLRPLFPSLQSTSTFDLQSSLPFHARRTEIQEPAGILDQLNPSPLFHFNALVFNSLLFSFSQSSSSTSSSSSSSSSRSSSSVSTYSSMSGPSALNCFAIVPNLLSFWTSRFKSSTFSVL